MIHGVCHEISAFPRIDRWHDFLHFQVINSQLCICIQSFSHQVMWVTFSIFNHDISHIYPSHVKTKPTSSVWIANLDTFCIFGEIMTCPFPKSNYKTRIFYLLLCMFLSSQIKVNHCDWSLPLWLQTGPSGSVPTIWTMPMFRFSGIQSMLNFFMHKQSITWHMRGVIKVGTR